jgi:hypothetical protein
LHRWRTKAVFKLIRVIVSIMVDGVTVGPTTMLAFLKKLRTLVFSIS